MATKKSPLPFRLPSYFTKVTYLEIEGPPQHLQPWTRKYHALGFRCSFLQSDGEIYAARIRRPWLWSQNKRWPFHWCRRLSRPWYSKFTARMIQNGQRDSTWEITGHLRGWVLHHVTSHANFEDVEASLNQEYSGDVICHQNSCLLEQEGTLPFWKCSCTKSICA